MSYIGFNNVKQHGIKVQNILNNKISPLTKIKELQKPGEKLKTSSLQKIQMFSSISKGDHGGNMAF